MKNLKSIIFAAILSVLTVTGVALSEFFPDVIVTSPNGVWTDTRAYTDINAAITAIGSNIRDVYVVDEEVVTALTVPSTVNLHFVRNGSISNSGLLTLNTTNISAPNRQIFTGVGAIDFASGSVIKSGWFQNIESAFALTANDTITLIVSKPQTITASYSPGDDVHLKWESPGNILSIDVGVVVGNLKNIEAGHYQIFAGAGDFDFLDGVKLNLSWFARLRSALTWIESEEATIIIDKSETIDLSTATTINENLEFISGSILDGSGVETLTIGGEIKAGLHQIVGSNLTLSFGGSKIVNPYPQWWGAKGDGVTDDTSALQSFATAIKNAGLIGKIPPTENFYLISSTLDLTGNGFGVTGEGRDGVYIKSNNVAASIIKIGGYGDKFEGLNLAYTVTPTVLNTAAIPILISGLRRSVVSRVKIGLCYDAIKIEQATGTGMTNGTNAEWSNVWSNIEVYGFFNIGIHLLTYGTGSSGSIWDNIIVSNSSFSHNLVSAILISAYNNFAGNMINVESMKPTSHLVDIRGACNTVSLNALHFESIDPQTNGKGFITNASGTKIKINGIVLRDIDFTSGGLTSYSVFIVGNKTQIEVDGLYEVSTTIAAAAWSLGSNSYGSVSTTSVRVRAATYDQITQSIAIAGSLLTTNPGQFPILQQNNQVNYDHKYVDRTYQTATTGSITLINGYSGKFQFFATNALTAATTVTLETDGALRGMEYRVSRTVGNTGGPWNLSVGGLKNLAQNEWCDVYFDGSNWKLTAFGSL